MTTENKKPTEKDLDIAWKIYNTYWDHAEDHPLGVKPILDALDEQRLEGMKDPIVVALADACNLKLGALQYDIWMHRENVVGGNLIEGQKEMVVKAIEEMKDALCKCETAIAQYRQAIGDGK